MNKGFEQHCIKDLQMSSKQTHAPSYQQVRIHFAPRMPVIAMTPVRAGVGQAGKRVKPS